MVYPSFFRQARAQVGEQVLRERCSSATVRLAPSSTDAQTPAWRLRAGRRSVPNRLSHPWVRLVKQLKKRCQGVLERRKPFDALELREKSSTASYGLPIANQGCVVWATLSPTPLHADLPVAVTSGSHEGHNWVGCSIACPMAPDIRVPHSCQCSGGTCAQSPDSLGCPARTYPQKPGDKLQVRTIGLLL
jgi:hypothetical protein